MHSRSVGVSQPAAAFPKEKDNETFAQSVISVGRSGRYICIRCDPEGTPSGWRPDAAVPTETTKLRVLDLHFVTKKHSLFGRNGDFCTPS